MSKAGRTADLAALPALHLPAASITMIPLGSGCRGGERIAAISAGAHLEDGQGQGRQEQSTGDEPADAGHERTVLRLHG